MLPHCNSPRTSPESELYLGENKLAFLLPSSSLRLPIEEVTAVVTKRCRAISLPRASGGRGGRGGGLRLRNDLSVRTAKNAKAKNGCMQAAQTGQVKSSRKASPLFDRIGCVGTRRRATTNAERKPRPTSPCLLSVECVCITLVGFCRDLLSAGYVWNYIKRIIDTQISPEGARPCFARFDERMKANEYAMEYGLTLDAHAPHFLDE